eukprot:CAMPEP_0183465394 /NCGR_PEP_ID=MMETSP0370-20130417/147204_1 /TAXON_ID=268820 /ORGANISM="Peridinium aciculiferum, Strain PAER-2" /LENGTH=60 /DNA_ID=CAMNT_0025657597 /DNA_START=22 /DNA_END=200 /DNA_ORIENTATION=+
MALSSALPITANRLPWGRGKMSPSFFNRTVEMADKCLAESEATSLVTFFVKLMKSQVETG